MRIVVTRRAAHVGEAEGQNFICATRGTQLVAIGARYRGMRATQSETRVPVFGDRESGTMEILNRMAALAFVFVGRSRKLAVMCILVAFQASLEFHLVDSIFACGQMAFSAFYGNVLPP